MIKMFRDEVRDTTQVVKPGMVTTSDLLKRVEETEKTVDAMNRNLWRLTLLLLGGLLSAFIASLVRG
jgi:hypothetical protein